MKGPADLAPPGGVPLACLLVHGMGRSPLSWAPLRLRLRAAGFPTSTFGYCAAVEAVAAIQARLLARMTAMGARGAYVVVGHSLGGVLLRGALAQLPAGAPAPRHLFLLGSPVRPAALAQRLHSRWLYRVLTGDAGQLLASEARMGTLGAPPIATTAILGTRGWTGRHSPFHGGTNDGLVGASEARAAWIGEERQVPELHSFLPSSPQVAALLLEHLRALTTT